MELEHQDLTGRIIGAANLRAVDRDHGLLINFATPTLEVTRVHAGE